LANKETVYIPDDPLVLTNISTDADTYEWNFGDGNSSTDRSPVHYYREEGEFDIYLVARSNNGCIDTFNLPTTIIGELDGRIELPNAFTPNPNGGNGGIIDQNNPARLNDVFYAKIRGAAKYELNIFNKWGELLFVSKDVNIGWDGYYKGELCQQDVYVLKIKAEFIDGKTVVKVGDLMLLR
jgi:gliding motility-associated-like protein